MITATFGSVPDASGIGWGVTRHHALNTVSTPPPRVIKFVIANGHASHGIDRFSDDSIHGTYRAVATSNMTPATRTARWPVVRGYESPNRLAAAAIGPGGATPDSLET